MSQLRVFIVDDNFVVRRGLRNLLEGEADIAVVGEASTGTEVIRQVQDTSADVVLMDVRMPGMDGVTSTSEVLRVSPASRVVMLSVVDDPTTVAGAILAGARAYLVYGQFTPESLLEAIRTVMSTDGVVTPSVSPSLIALLKGTVSTFGPDKQASGNDVLTVRETEVLKFIVAGRANPEIARDLGIEEKTVKNHINSIYAKLQIQSREEAIHYVLRNSLRGQ
ncbi:MAG: response regulator transcription factor [Dehalococcoidales bacterium]|nr:response regulator transcription factor [Dehalococcoidales bacterium]